MEMRRYNGAAIIALSLFLGTVVAEKGMEAVAVIMKFESGFEQNIIGVVNFQQKDCTEAVYVHVNISGLSPGMHGFHIHDKGDLTNGCISTGPHFNPGNSNHGGPNDHVRHAGDLGNIDVKDNGMVNTTIMDKAISLFGVQGIVGRAVVIHANADDLGKGGNPESTKTGNAGSRFACGVIGIKSDVTVWPCTRSAAPLAQASWCLLALALAFAQYCLF